MRDVVLLQPRGLLAHALVQTALANLRGPRGLPRDVTAQTLHVPLRNGLDRLVADAYWQPRPAPALLVFHGVGGSSTSAYVLQAVDAALAAGLHVVALNLRGVGAGAAVARKLYHAGLVDDVADALATVAQVDAVTSMGLLGFSLGGQLALKYAAQLGDAPPLNLRAITTISAPFDLAANCRHLDAMPFWPYRRHILGGLVRHCGRLAAHAELPVPLERLGRLRFLEAFDDALTAPMHGFADAQAYYRHASCGDGLAQVRVPTLCIHADNDPVVPIGTLLAGRSRASGTVKFLCTPHGGHVGFVGSVRQLRASWAVARSLAFVQAEVFGAA